MLFKIPQIISYVSHIFTLERGDLIITGSPEGVGSVNVGDVIEAGGDKMSTIKVDVVSR